MQREPRKTSPNPRIRQSNDGRHARKEGVPRRVCNYCDDSGVVQQVRYTRSYKRWTRWMNKRNHVKRWAEPKAKLVTCPVCQVGGLR
jgi:hypothetical protein